MSTCKTKVIYLDGNGTTFQSKPSIEETTKWMKLCSNPSTNNKLSLPSKKVIEEGKKYILRHCNVNESLYSVSFTSCGSESNIFIIKSIASYYRYKHKKLPHIISSNIEHSSIIDCLDNMIAMKEAEVSWISPMSNGCIHHKDIENKIKKNTCLITVMGANNETGAINDIESIGRVAKKYQIPFHTDYVQLFGKHKIDLSNQLITSLSVSFHKLYGPLGIGLLIIHKKIIDMYNLCGIKNTMDPLRGIKMGTPAVPLIAGAIASMKDNFVKRSMKDKHLLKLRMLFFKLLESKFPIVYYDTYANKKSKLPETCIIIFGPHMEETDKYMHNTILLSVTTSIIQFCNVLLKKYLEKHNIIVSIGSACHTHSKNASHVIMNLKVPPFIRRGVLRVSFVDTTTEQEIHKCSQILVSGILEQLPKNNTKSL